MPLYLGGNKYPAPTFDLKFPKQRGKCSCYMSNYTNANVNMSSCVSIESLPPEILEVIFLHLDVKNLGNCSKACLRWQRIISDLFKNKG